MTSSLPLPERTLMTVKEENTQAPTQTKIIEKEMIRGEKCQEKVEIRSGCMCVTELAEQRS